jgi:hypothetical protein
MEKGIFSRKQCIFSKERPKFLEKTYVLNFFAITTISYLFLYKLVTYPWKGLKKRYNFMVGNTSTKIHMQKL